MVWGGATLLLLALLLAMQFTKEVRWTRSGFAVFGVMLAVPLGEAALRALLPPALDVAAVNTPGSSVAQRGTYKVGQPYKIDGVTYTPRETFTQQWLRERGR